jgi:hypothetical protein
MFNNMGSVFGGDKRNAVIMGKDEGVFFSLVHEFKNLEGAMEFGFIFGHKDEDIKGFAIEMGKGSERSGLQFLCPFNYYFCNFFL